MSQTKGTDPGNGISGFGTTIVGGVSGAIGMVVKLSIEGVEASEIDVSTMNAPGRWMKFIAGMKDAKGINIDLLYEKANMTLIQGLVGGANEVWTIELPDGSTYVQTGFIKKLGTEIPLNDKISQQATFRMSGPPVFNEAS